jgi:hypothetical protein
VEIKPPLSVLFLRLPFFLLLLSNHRRGVQPAVVDLSETPLRPPVSLLPFVSPSPPSCSPPTSVLEPFPSSSTPDALAPCICLLGRRGRELMHGEVSGGGGRSSRYGGKYHDESVTRDM